MARRESFQSRRELITTIVEQALHPVRPIYKPQSPEEFIGLLRRCLEEIDERAREHQKCAQALRALIEIEESKLPPKQIVLDAVTSQVPE